MSVVDAALSGGALAGSLSGGEDLQRSTVLLEACALPEIGSRLADRRLLVDASLRGPIQVDDDLVRIHPSALVDSVRAAVMLREALEIIDLGGPSWPHRILAHLTARVYAITNMQTMRGSARLDELTDATIAAETLLRVPSDGRLLEDYVAIATATAGFLAGRDDPGGLDPPCSPAQIRQAARALPLALPTGVLLTRGGDHRQVIDWTELENSYGVSPRPAPWAVQFSSCTASAPSLAGFELGCRARLRLAKAALADSFDQELDRTADRIRSRLLAALGLAPGDADVVVTPSGTDAELVALAVTQHTDRPVHTVLVAASEIGSGSVLAATGRHFSSKVPSGRAVTPGDLIDGFVAPTVSRVEVRDDHGRLRSGAEVEAEIDLILEEHTRDGLVLLHVVEGSKTGVRLPRHDRVVSWQERHGDRLQLVVDAAQMRIDQATAIAHLERGALVIVTGSKFFGGPPFSGAVLVPPSLAARAADLPLPAGMNDYLSRTDLPAGWRARDGLTSPANLGLLLRWEVAVTEMRAFHNVSAGVRDEVIRAISAGIRALLDANPRVDIVESPFVEHSGDPASGLDDLPTIFTFLLRDGDRHLDIVEVRALQGRLQHRQPDSRVVAPAASRAVHLGQAVAIADGKGGHHGGLRIAIGAPNVSRVVFGHTRGPTWSHRVDHEIRDVAAALAKIDHLLAEPATPAPSA